MKIAIEIAERPPVRCSSCFGQYPDRVHVDFEAAWDGPVFREGIAGAEGEVTNVIATTIDDLVLCEECLRRAAELLGLKDPGELGEALEDAERRRQELLERNRGLEEHNRQLEAALASKKALAAA